MKQVLCYLDNYKDEKKDNRFKDLKNYIELNNKAVESKDVVKSISCLIDISTQHGIFYIFY